jgi:hypothetical protein
MHYYASSWCAGSVVALRLSYMAQMDAASDADAGGHVARASRQIAPREKS